EMWGVSDLPIFMVERRFADELEASAEQADQINLINDEEGVRWLYSFLSANKRKTYCLYEAPFADSIRRAAQRAGLPADVVVEVGGMVLPDGSQTRTPAEVPADSRGPAHRGSAYWVGDGIVDPVPGHGQGGDLGPVRRTGLEQDATDVVGRGVLGD